jgi:hypothetical protein
VLPEALERDRRRTPLRSTRTAERKLLDRALDLYALAGEALRDGLPGTPRASVNYGAGGIAYALLRIAQRRGDPCLLAAADLWSQRAYALSAQEGAFYNTELEIERKTVGEISLFHSASGLHCVRALVSAAQGDAGAANRALHAFVEHTGRPYSSEEPSGAPDLTLGKGSLLLGCAELMQSIPDLGVFDLAVIRTRGEEIASDLLMSLQAGPIESSNLNTLGIAHGWGGLIFAQLRWAQAMRRDPDSVVRRRLQELATLAQPQWQRRIRDAVRVGPPAAQGIELRRAGRAGRDQRLRESVKLGHAVLRAGWDRLCNAVGVSPDRCGYLAAACQNGRAACRGRPLETFFSRRVVQGRRGCSAVDRRSARPGRSRDAVVRGDALINPRRSAARRAAAQVRSRASCRTH